MFHLFHRNIAMNKSTSMGVTKSDLFTERQNHLSSIAKVLGHPARIAIIEHLIAADKCINSDLVNELGLAQATISQHLRELKATGVIKGTIEGTSMCYCIDADVWKQIQTDFESLFTQYNACADGCC